MREHLYSVYIMASRLGVLYIGVTSDLQTRVRQHKAGTFGGVLEEVSMLPLGLLRTL